MGAAKAVRAVALQTPPHAPSRPLPASVRSGPRRPFKVRRPRRQEIKSSSAGPFHRRPKRLERVIHLGNPVIITVGKGSRARQVGLLDVDWCPVETGDYVKGGAVMDFSDGHGSGIRHGH